MVASKKKTNPDKERKLWQLKPISKPHSSKKGKKGYSRKMKINLEE